MDKTIGLVELIYLYMHRHGDYGCRILDKKKKKNQPKVILSLMLFSYHESQEEGGGNFEQFI